MFNGIDAVGIDKNPQREHNIYWALYYISFWVLGTLFLLSFFVGLVVDTFEREKQRLGGIAFMTAKQKEWISIQMSLVKLKPHLEVNLSFNLVNLIFYNSGKIQSTSGVPNAGK